MWIFFAFGSAIFAGITAILAKCGMKNMDTNVATALRTIVVLLFSWLMVLISGKIGTIYELNGKTWFFLITSGLATGISWLCYFRALQLGDVNKVTPIDKSSTVLTMLLAFIFLGEKLTILKAAAMLLIGAGTFLMITKTSGTKEKEQLQNGWIIFAFASTIFASLTAILGKIGMQGVDSNLGTAIRTVVVLIMAWIVVFVTGKQHTVKNTNATNWVFLIFSGIATGTSWLCYYRALQLGDASVVVPIDKLSILITIAFSFLVFKEKLNKKSSVGLISIVAGTLLLLF